jgi:peroxin-14
MIEKSKDSEKQSLAELQQELKSLKALLLSRSNSIPSAPPSPAPALPFGVGRPSIPSWQLTGLTGTATNSESSTPGPVTTPLPVTVDKGKAPERTTEIPP